MEAQLEEYLKSDAQDFVKTSSFVFLPPIQKHSIVIPILGLAYNFAKKIPEIRLQVGLFAEEQKRPVAVGLRFETPEGNGLHNYYHAQPIRSFFQVVKMPCNGWVPTSFPTLCLNAVNAGALVVCMLETLYGLPHLVDLPASGGGLKRYTKDLHWIDPNPGRRSRFGREAQTGRWRWRP